MGASGRFYCNGDGPVRWMAYDDYLSEDTYFIFSNLQLLRLTEVHYGNSRSYYCSGMKNGLRFVAQGQLIVMG